MPDIMPAEAPVLRVDDLTVRFRRRGMDVAAVNGVSFALARGETLTILGKSGSGKSVSLKALMGLLPDYAQIEGDVWLDGKPVLELPPAELAKLRGGAVSMIFQEPMAALDPVYTVGEQIAETIVQHEGVTRATAMQRTLDLLDHVKIPSAARRMKNYPHELSGGMRQRAMIALALACSPESCCWPTNRPPRSTSRCRSRSCCCCASCRRNSAWRSCSSRTTWAQRRRSPTASQ